MFTPQEYLEYAIKTGRGPDFKPPKGVIICYQKTLVNHIVENHKVTKGKGFHDHIHLLDDFDKQIAVLGNFGIGAPAVVPLIEELIAFGVKRFVSIGTAGILQKNLSVGDLVVCNKAIRDEGTSFHYLLPSKYSYASPTMTKNLETVLKKYKLKFKTGSSWTIDAPYRETVAEAREYQKEGVLTVEMEISALFALAQYRKVDIGALLTISDSLAELQWKPKFYSKKTHQSLETIYKVAVESLLEK